MDAHAVDHVRERLRAIQQSSLLLEGLFAHAPVAYQIYDSEGHSLLTNQAFLDLFGSEPPPGYSCLKDDIAAERGMLEIIHRAFKGEVVRVPTMWYDPRDLKSVHVTEGKRVAISITAFPLPDATGVAKNVVFAFRDVTAEMIAREDVERERHRLEHALTDQQFIVRVLREKEAELLESQAHLTASQRIGRIGSWELDLTVPEEFGVNAVRWTDEFFRVLGYEPGEAEVTQDTFFNRVHPEDRDAIAKAVQQAINNGTVYSLEHRVVFPTGEERVVHERGELIRDSATGRPMKMIGTGQDVTERKEVEHRLREYAELQQMLIESSPLAIIACDFEGTISVWNAAAERVFGWSREEIVGRENPSVDHKRWSELLELSRLGVSQVGREEQWVRKDGSDVWIEASAAPLRDGRGRFTGTMMMIVDITERKRAEARRRLMADELDHRVKNNLAGVLALADLSLSTSTTMEQFRTAFTGRIRAMAQTHTMLAQRKWDGVELRDVVETLLGPYNDPAHSRVELRGGAVILSSRAALPVTLMLHELTTNALKHGALGNRSGRVTVEWSHSGGELCVVWKEQCETPVVSAGKRGSGTEIIEGLMRHELRGRVETRFEPAGLRCTLHIPLGEQG